MAVFHHRNGLFSALLQRFDHLLDILGGLLSTAGQGPHLIGDYCKPTALLASPGSLDRCVQRQQIGLQR